jgi:hypothetical protein
VFAVGERVPSVGFAVEELGLFVGLDVGGDTVGARVGDDVLTVGEVDGLNVSSVLVGATEGAYEGLVGVLVGFFVGL